MGYLQSCLFQAYIIICSYNIDSTRNPGNCYLLKELITSNLNVSFYFKFYFYRVILQKKIVESFKNRKIIKVFPNEFVFQGRLKIL